MSEIRAAAEKVFSEVKENFPDFDEQKYEWVIEFCESENNQIPAGCAGLLRIL